MPKRRSILYRKSGNEYGRVYIAYSHYTIPSPGPSTIPTHGFVSGKYVAVESLSTTNSCSFSPKERARHVVRLEMRATDMQVELAPARAKVLLLENNSALHWVPRGRGLSPNMRFSFLLITI